MSDATQGIVGIVVGGGPAPGINGVISAVTLEARQRGHHVIGFLDGFKWLARGGTDHFISLDIKDVSRIHFQGGSILRTTRENPSKDPEKLSRTFDALQRAGVKYLVTIGGDDTALTASKLAEKAAGSIRVVHVPKTIDNDLPLPGDHPTFGYQTARHVGVEILKNLMEDSKTTNRWYFVVAMGRHAGHLALGIGKAAGATISLIAEEFRSHPVKLREICDVLEGAILKRRVKGREDGVAVIAEGLLETIDPDDLKNVPGLELEYDPFGHLRLGEIDFGKLLTGEIIRRFKERGEKTAIVRKNIGYELRCAAPIPFDCEYVRDLGYGAIKYVLSEEAAGPGKGAIVCIDSGRMRPLYFKDMLDPETGKTRVRMVDLNTESYEVARNYMIRLEREDFEESAQLQRLADAARMTTDAFRERFEYLVEAGL
jgi:ATP-dependent phosphofructokinase / diphosphate-dependent phosphofructokinase